jgi:hypothetical protein
LGSGSAGNTFTPTQSSLSTPTIPRLTVLTVLARRRRRWRPTRPQLLLQKNLRKPEAPPRQLPRIIVRKQLHTLFAHLGKVNVPRLLAKLIHRHPRTVLSLAPLAILLATTRVFLATQALLLATLLLLLPPLRFLLASLLVELAPLLRVLITSRFAALITTGFTTRIPATPTRPLRVSGLPRWHGFTRGGFIGGGVVRSSATF